MDAGFGKGTTSVISSAMIPGPRGVLSGRLFGAADVTPGPPPRQFAILAACLASSSSTLIRLPTMRSH